MNDCKWCSGFYTIIESSKVWNMIYLALNKTLTKDMLEESDNSLVLETRNGYGYLRLGDRGEMNCLDHDETIEINFCPNCGREFVQ